MTSAIDCEGVDQWLSGGGVQIYPQTATAVPSTEKLVMNCAPNPFNPMLKISFEMPEPENISVSIYNSFGKVIAEYFNVSDTLFWDGADKNGASVASGVYFVEGKSGNKVTRKKVTLVR